MKVVDPQSALLTNAEVYDFLKSHKPRPADKKIGAYKPVDLVAYNQLCKDVSIRYKLETTSTSAKSMLTVKRCKSTSIRRRL